MGKKVKVSIYLEEKDAELLRSYAKKLNTTFSGSATIAIGFGMLSMKFAEDPKMRKYFQKEIDQIIDENTKAS